MLKKSSFYASLLFVLFQLSVLGAAPSLGSLDETAGLPQTCPLINEGLATTVACDYLLWTATQDESGFATTGYKNNAPVNPSKGHVHHPKSHFASGFKFSLAQALPHDGWDLMATYTWFHQNNKKQRVRKNLLYPTIWRDWLTGGNFSPFFSPREADGTWKLQFNAVDLHLGRPFFISPRLICRPFFGLKGSWQSQDDLIHYESVDNQIIHQFERIHLEQHFWGVGLLGGSHFKFGLGKNWSLWGRGAFSTLASFFSSERRDQVDVNTLEIEVLNIDDRFYTLKPVAEWALGIAYESNWAEDRYHVEISCALEQQMWWSQCQWYNVLEESGHGDLALQGLTVQLRFDF